MNRELYGLLIAFVTLGVIFLPLKLFIFAVSLLSLFMAKELSDSLKIENLWFASFLSPALFYADTVVGILYISLIALSYGYIRWNLNEFLKAIFVLLYTGFFPSYLIDLKEKDTYILLIFFLTIWANDVFAYYIGKNFGKRPLFPKLSPRKTLEGFIGGLVIAVVLFLLISPLDISKAFPISVITVITGVIGDYFKSFIKRQTGIKDFSGILGPHGGFVDRFDAVIFAAPIFYRLITEYVEL